MVAIGARTEIVGIIGVGERVVRSEHRIIEHQTSTFNVRLFDVHESAFDLASSLYGTDCMGNAR
jgi:hypothetical protein